MTSNDDIYELSANPIIVDCWISVSNEVGRAVISPMVLLLWCQLFQSVHGSYTLRKLTSYFTEGTIYACACMRIQLVI